MCAPVSLRGLSASECEARVAGMLAQQFWLEILEYEFGLLACGIRGAERQARVAVRGAELAVMRDRLVRQFHDFVEMQQALVR